MIGLRKAVLLDGRDAELLLEMFGHLPRFGVRVTGALADFEARLRKAFASASDSACDTRAGVRTVGPQGDSSEHALYDLVDTREAAAILGCTPANVRDLARRGRLPAHRAGRGWVYPAAAVVALAERRAAQRG